MHDYYDLGTYSRPVTTHSSQAQRWFDRGLLWCYGYNHHESIRCFHKAIEHDRDCAMAYWGIAYASGPNYNKRWDAFIEQELKEAVAQARLATQAALAHIDGATPSPTCARHCLWTTTCLTTSHGAGCNRSCMRWARCCWSRAG
jgi:hypothetical protein